MDSLLPAFQFVPFHRSCVKHSLTSSKQISATPLVDSSTPHSYSAASKLFHQPLLSSQLLSKFLGANSDSLKKAVLSKDRTVSGKTFAAQKATLAEFISAICKDEKGAAGGMLEAVLEELSTQTQYVMVS